MSNFIDAFESERNSAREHRRDLRDVVTALSGSVRELSHTVAEIKPLVEDYRTKRDEAIGAAKAGKIIGRAVLLTSNAASAAFGALLHKFF